MLHGLGISINKIISYITFFIGLLLLIFLFIYIGISAFSVGGSFGSVINSAIPVLGGLGASSKEKSESLEKNPEDKQNMKA